MKDIPKGFMLDDDNNVVMKPARPQTLREAKDRVIRIFRKNGWGEGSQFVYMRNCGISEPRPVAELSIEDIRTVLASLEKSRMVLFRD